MDLRYVSEFDELLWTLDVDSYRFYECKLGSSNRPEFIKWLKDNIQHTIYLWNGMLAVDKGDFNWGSVRSPGLKFYLIFEDPRDEEIFALRYLGNVCLRQHKTGTEAYHKRKADPND